MVLWFMAAKRPVHYGVGFGREAAKMSIFAVDFGRKAANLSIFELDFGREAATCPFWHVFGRAAANLSIFEVDFGREEVTCPFLTCFWPRAANLSISSTFFEDMSNMFFLKTFKKNFTIKDDFQRVFLRDFRTCNMYLSRYGILRNLISVFGIL